MGGDILRWPLVGPLLRWRHARTLFQSLLLAVAGAVILHGLFGPQVSPANLSTVLTWVHYRGLLVIALLAAGNLFCAGCPFILVRDAARRTRMPTWRWPRRLRTKWMALVLFAGVLFAYELFDLWALPRATAVLVLAYFGSALVIDMLFTGAAFCKYLCPVGQFNFAASLVSPLEVRVRDVSTCRTCRTFDCITGRPAAVVPPRQAQRGCELGLFQPVKVGNMDCTFCLDCVQACPHDNVGIVFRAPGLELLDDRRRSGVGRLARRPDIATLAVLFAFGALMNAFGMVAPVRAVEAWVAQLVGASSEAPVLALLFVGGLVILPALLLGLAAGATRLIASDRRSLGTVVTGYAYALVPFGLGTWLAHYGFHFLTGALTVVPVTQSAAIDALGWAALGEPRWHWMGIRAGLVFPIQLGCVMLGTLGSTAVAYGISERDYPKKPVLSALPWVILLLLLCAAALWLVAQPMDMRSAGPAG